MAAARQFLVLYKKVENANKPLRGRNLQAFTKEIRVLKSARNKEHDRLLKINGEQQLMAKRGRPARVQDDGGMISSGRSGGGEHPNGSPQGSRQSADPLGDFAADLGKFLGGVQSRATSWLDQRKAITEQLTQIRDTPNTYLQQLGAEGSQLVERFEKARRGRPPGSGAAKRGPGRSPGLPMRRRPRP